LEVEVRSLDILLQQNSQMKKIASAALLILPLMTGAHFVQGADPVRLEGKTDQA